MGTFKASKVANSMSELMTQLPDVQWNTQSSCSYPFLRFMPKMPAIMVPTLTANVKICKQTNDETNNQIHLYTHL